MIELDDEMERRCIAAAVRYLKEVHGITYLPAVAMVYAMAREPERQFHDILWLWTDCDHKIVGYPRQAEEVWRSEVCRHLLKAGADTSGGIEQWFEARAREVREIADGIFVGA